MSSLLVIAIIAIVSALVFYTIGVWSEGLLAGSRLGI